MKKLLLFDGHSILNRAYYALPPLSNSKGVYTNAVYGFLNIMMKFVGDESPDYLMVAFDESAPTFRHELFKEYKGNRKKMDEELRMQVPIIQELLKTMDIPIVKKPGLEADDILGTISKAAQAKGFDVTVCSGDRDLLQLADEHIKIAIPKTKGGNTIVEEYKASDVMEKMGVTPTEFIDVKALMGDSSDNIPGVSGIGEKTAYALISAYHSLEEAYAHVDELKPKRASENLKAEIEIARLSKILATINIQSDIEFDINAAEFKDPYTKEAYKMCQELELKQFLKRFPETSDSVNIPKAELKSFEKIDSFEQLLQKLPSLKEAKICGVDMFLSHNHPNGIAVCVGGDAVFCEGEEISEVIDTIISESSAVIVAANLKELLHRIPKVPRRKERFFDVFIAEYLLDPTRNEYQLVGSTPQERAYECESKYTDLVERLEKNGLSKLFYEMEMPLVFVLSSMERKGIYIDIAELDKYNMDLSKSIARFESDIYKECGEVFNINSPKQLGVILFEKMQIPGSKKTKTGYSTSADILEKLAGDYPVINKILMYRQYTKLKSTYAEGLRECVAADERIHTTFQQTVTATGRLSSTNPNLQNIPIRMELGRAIRKTFKAAPDCTFVDADYSQIELRVLAHMSGDENLIEAYKEDKDIHKATAAKVFHVPFEEVTDSQRSAAKAVNFGIVYGISSFGLGEDLNISRKDAQQYIDDYYKAYPSLKEFLDSLVARTKKFGYSETMFGRKRQVPEIKASNFMQRQFGERIAMNTPIQGSAADIIKLAMIRVWERLEKEQLKSKLILQVHDELLIEAKDSELLQVKALLKEEMENAVKLSVPLVVDIKCGKTWFEAK